MLPDIDPLNPPSVELRRRYSCFNKVPDMAERILNAAYQGLLNAIGDSEDCRDMVAYVTIGEPVGFIPDSLVVWIGDIHIKEGWNPNSIPGGGVAEVVFNIQLTESGYPDLIEIPEGIAEPNPLSENEAAWYSTQHAVAMWATLIEAVHNENLFGEGWSPRLEVTLGPLQPLSPEGGCVSWATTVTVDLESVN